MNLGTENRNKTMAAAILGGLAVLAIAYRLISFAGGTSPQAANGPAATLPPPTATRASRPAARNATTAGGKKASPAASLDPTLKLALLASSENMKYTGNGRNIFRAEEDIPAPVAPPIRDPKKIDVPPPPPPPPPINLKFFGFASKPGEAKRIFLSKGEDVFIAGEGDIVDRRYKVLQIGPASVTIQDVLTNNTQQIPLTQG
ncbi:MAG: hypothetical protein JO249_21360 [Acidobacteria bacterium]|nr:hypothetical protein [Acidobacteriota bacterium]